MNDQLAKALDQLSLVGLALFIHITCISIAAMCLCWAFRHRPAARHFVAVSAIGTIAICPLLIFLPMSRWCVIPVNLAATPTGVEVVHDVADHGYAAVKQVGAPSDFQVDATVASVQKVDSRLRDSARLPQDEAAVRPTPVSEQGQQDTAHIVIPSAAPNATRQVSVAEMPGTIAGHTEADAISPAIETAQLSAPTVMKLLLRRALGFLVTLWFAGIGLLAARFLWHHQRLRRIVSECEIMSSQRLANVIRRVANEQSLRRVPSVLISRSFPMPIVTGVVRPRVVLPTSIVQESSAEEMHIILSHECAHIARRDLWVSLFQRFLATIYWPHAFVHILNRQLSRAREELCDNHVLAAINAPTYAKALLRLGESVADLPALAISLPWIGKHWPLEDRVAGLLDPNRRTETRVGRCTAFALLFVLLVVVAGTAGVAIGEKTPDEQVAATSVDTKDPAQLLKALSDRAAYWLAPASPNLKSLEYSFMLGHVPRKVLLDKGTKNVRYSVWQGCSLRTGIHTLLREPARFSTEVSEDPSGDTLTINATLPAGDARPIGIEVGNGIEGSWRGYYSHGARNVVLTIDKKRLVPLEEKSGPTTVRYADWKEISPARWVPGTIDIMKDKTRYRMHFEWFGNAVWLLSYSESISRDGTTIVTRTRDVKVNNEATERQLTDREERQENELAIVRRMLDRNRAWLAPDLSEVESLEYTFHTAREDVREQGFWNRDGIAVLEVIHDGQGKMGDRLGERRIALPSQEVAYTHRDARFTKLTPRPKRLKNQPADEQFRHYARIGCQFDLPLFRYDERLEDAEVKIEDGQWNGQPCDVARISGLGRDVYFGAGTMFGFTSWSYVHHIRPLHELIYIDRQRHLPVHETLAFGSEQKTFEIDYLDYVEVSDNQWAPLSIRIESKGYFTANYRFQVAEGNHWILKEVVSWFDPANKSQGVIENLHVNQPSDLFKAAMKQVESSRKLFREAGDQERLRTTATPIQFGKRTKVGPYSVLLTVAGIWSSAIKIETTSPDVTSVVPVLLLDKQQRPLFAAHVTLAAEGKVRRGEVGLGFSRSMADVSSIVVPDIHQNGGAELALGAASFHWDEPITVNVPDRDKGATRAYEVLVTRNDNGSASAKIAVASSNGPAKFMIDLSVGLLDSTGKLVAAGLNNGTMLVKGGIVEETFDIDLGAVAKLDDDSKVIIAVNVGDVVSAPMGSVWGTFMRDDSPIPLGLLLAADDEACQTLGLQQLSGKIRIDKEFFEDLRDRERLIERNGTRDKLIAPHVQTLTQIAQDTDDVAVLASALRLLGHSGKAECLDVVRSQLSHADASVRDAAAIAVAMLGEGDGFDRLQEIIQRRKPSAENERDARLAFQRNETDVLIALASIGDARSVKLLGETLLADLGALEVVTNEKGRQDLIGRPDRIKHVISVLGYCRNDDAASWLIAAAVFFDKSPEIAEAVEQIPLAVALSQYEDKTQEFVARQIEQGNYAYIRAFKLNGVKRPYFVPAVHKMLIHSDTTAWTAHQGVTYLWNVGSPEALEVLRDAHRRGIHHDNLRTRFAICSALAGLGDDRGLRDAYDALRERYELNDPPPQEKKQRKAWENRREELDDGVEDVLSRVSKASVTNFVQSQLNVKTRAERRAVVELLWYLPETPPSVTATLVRWKADADMPLSAELTKIIERE